MSKITLEKLAEELKLTDAQSAVLDRLYAKTHTLPGAWSREKYTLKKALDEMEYLIDRKRKKSKAVGEISRDWRVKFETSARYKTLSEDLEDKRKKDKKLLNDKREEDKTLRENKRKEPETLGDELRRAAGQPGPRYLREINATFNKVIAPMCKSLTRACPESHSLRFLYEWLKWDPTEVSQTETQDGLHKFFGDQGLKAKFEERWVEIQW